MAKLTVLYEHATGFTLFKVKEFEEIGSELAQVEKSVRDLQRFTKIVELLAFAPFKTSVDALESINSISEGVLPESLQIFLETNIPKVGKMSKVTLGVADSKLGASINEKLGLKIQHTGFLLEILRGIRFHFPSLMKGFAPKLEGIAQLGLGHSYSRAKVKFNVNKVDNMIIHSVSLLDQLDKDLNTYSMRIREWYSYHFPELYKIVPENYLYAKVVKYIGDRKQLTEEKVEGLEEIIMDSGKAAAILSAAKSSMGMDISPIDLTNVLMFTNRVISLSEYRRSLSEYLKNKMGTVAPNTAALIGEQVGARLISKAGSLTNLAKCPASTVQILGAEKALFRAMKTKTSTPKYGLIYHSTFISRAGRQFKGRASRFLSNKLSIASRIDAFSDNTSNIFGQKMKEQCEDRLKYFETGEKPPKNIDVMHDAFQESCQQNESLNASVKRKKNKKEKKNKKKQPEKENGEE
ncbi:NOSIC,Nop domain,NOP5, N-terminal [Cinara cedri]|uniref:Nucleolar protein 56 n=1 Tax=Cinara cedri TaxID=506608 RepID=A0A5E4MMX9_9HEMI|nr:NOSIC,Nop domain,NOP5, N-terminal [Cinara cedri]